MIVKREKISISTGGYTLYIILLHVYSGKSPFHSNKIAGKRKMGGTPLHVLHIKLCWSEMRIKLPTCTCHSKKTEDNYQLIPLAFPRS